MPNFEPPREELVKLFFLLINTRQNSSKPLATIMITEGEKDCETNCFILVLYLPSTVSALSTRIVPNHDMAHRSLVLLISILMKMSIFSKEGIAKFLLINL